MIVDVDATAGTVTLRLSNARLVAVGLVAIVVGIAVPAVVERHAPSLLVISLLATAGAAAVVVIALGRAVVLDDHGVTLGAARRGHRRIPWAEVETLSTVDGRLVVTTTDARAITGPRCDPDTLHEACEDAALLGLTPRSV